MQAVGIALLALFGGTTAPLVAGGLLGTKSYGREFPGLTIGDYLQKPHAVGLLTAAPPAGDTCPFRSVVLRESQIEATVRGDGLAAGEEAIGPCARVSLNKELFQPPNE